MKRQPTLMNDNKTTYLLNVKARILKLVFIPISGILGLAFFLFLSGYTGKPRRIGIPLLLRLDLNLIQVTIVLMVFLLLMFITIKLLFLDDHIYSIKMGFRGNTMLIEEKRFVMTFKLGKAEFVKFKTSKLLTKLYFDIYYRIGIITIKYNGDRYKFFFPVKNYGYEKAIHEIIKKHSK